MRCSTGSFPSIEEQEADLAEIAAQRAAAQRFDEGFAEYEGRLEEEEADRAARADQKAGS